MAGGEEEGKATGSPALTTLICALPLSPGAGDLSKDVQWEQSTEAAALLPGYRGEEIV